MKLKDIATKAIDEIRKRGDRGINNAELAELIETPKRRVYDVIAILKAADLISTVRDGKGTHLYWVSDDFSVERKNDELQQNFVAPRLKVSTTGSIYNVANRGNSVVIELDDVAELAVEPLYD